MGGDRLGASDEVRMSYRPLGHPDRTAALPQHLNGGAGNLDARHRARPGTASVSAPCASSGPSAATAPPVAASMIEASASSAPCRQLERSAARSAWCEPAAFARAHHGACGSESGALAAAGLTDDREARPQPQPRRSRVAVTPWRPSCESGDGVRRRPAGCSHEGDGHEGDGHEGDGHERRKRENWIAGKAGMARHAP